MFLAVPTAASWAAGVPGVHEGVASCADSTCHGRQIASGLVVRQNEVLTWQDTSSPAGAHSRAWRALTEPRAQAIARRLGLGPAEKAPVCLGCHSDAAPTALRGERFQIADGVGCEACHGGSGGWIASHAAVGATHMSNVSAGLKPLDDPAVRAQACLDCHFGSAKAGQFVSHQLMSAGHPRLAFELDLFTAMQRHHDVDADYVARGKQAPGGVKVWAVGQAIALQRALSLYQEPRLGQQGVFPEFYFFDCRGCHRSISDDPGARPSFSPNPARPIPSGMPAFDDENMIMLSAAAHIVAPEIADRFDRDVLAFHAALAGDRTRAVSAAAELARSAQALQRAFEAALFGRAQTLAILDRVAGEASAGRYTDYQGAAQAVMAVDTLLNAMVSAGQLPSSAAGAMRPDINRAYAEAHDANAYRAGDFRAVLSRIAADVGVLR